MTSKRVSCSCGLVSVPAGIWLECATLFGYPDHLLEHSPECCVRAGHPDGRELHGPPMRYGPHSREAHRREP